MRKRKRKGEREKKERENQKKEKENNKSRWGKEVKREERKRVQKNLINQTPPPLTINKFVNFPLDRIPHLPVHIKFHKTSQIFSPHNFTLFM